MPNSNSTSFNVCLSLKRDVATFVSLIHLFFRSSCCYFVCTKFGKIWNLWHVTLTQSSRLILLSSVVTHTHTSISFVGFINFISLLRFILKVWFDSLFAFTSMSFHSPFGAVIFFLLLQLYRKGNEKNFFVNFFNCCLATLNIFQCVSSNKIKHTHTRVFTNFFCHKTIVRFSAVFCCSQSGLTGRKLLHHFDTWLFNLDNLFTPKLTLLINTNLYSTPNKFLMFILPPTITFTAAVFDVNACILDKSVHARN